MTLDMAVPTTTASGVALDHEAILRSLNLNVRDPKTQAMLLICERYKIDPLMKHAVLISGNIYVTRDGYLHVAHRSGQFDGMEVLETGETPTHYTAKVAVYRKDMRHPFTYTGRFPKAERMAKTFGPEMAVKVAEVQALRRAFNVTGVAASDERWDVDPNEVVHAATPMQELAEQSADVPYGTGHADPTTGEVIETGEVTPATRRRPPPSRPTEVVPCRHCDYTGEYADVRAHLISEHGYVPDSTGKAHPPPKPPAPESTGPIPEQGEHDSSPGAGPPAPLGTREEAAAPAHPAAAASPGLITEGQVKLVHVLLGKAGVANDDRHRYLGALIDTEVTSVSALTKDEARRAIDALKAEAGEVAK